MDGAVAGRAAVEELGRIAGEGRLGVDHGRQRLVVDLHQAGRVGGPVGVGGDHRGDRFPHEADAVGGEERPAHRRVELRVGQRFGPQAVEIGGDHDVHHAGCGARRADLDVA